MKMVDIGVIGTIAIAVLALGYLILQWLSGQKKTDEGGGGGGESGGGDKPKPDNPTDPDKPVDPPVEPPVDPPVVPPMTDCILGDSTILEVIATPDKGNRIRYQRKGDSMPSECLYSDLCAEDKTIVDAWIKQHNGGSTTDPSGPTRDGTAYTITIDDSPFRQTPGTVMGNPSVLDWGGFHNTGYGQTASDGKYYDSFVDWTKQKYGTSSDPLGLKGAGFNVTYKVVGSVPIPDCPQGYHKDANGNCIKDTPTSCGANEILKDGKCVPNVKPTCSQGYEAKQNAEGFWFCDKLPVQTCPSGSHWDGTHCVSDPVQPSYNCEQAKSQISTWAKQAADYQSKGDWASFQYVSGLIAKKVQEARGNGCSL